ENNIFNTSQKVIKALNHLINPVIDFAVEKDSLAAPEPAQTGNYAISTVNSPELRQENQPNLLNRLESPTLLARPLIYSDTDQTIASSLLQDNVDRSINPTNDKAIQADRSIVTTVNLSNIDDNDLELYSPAWYRFGPMTSNSFQDSNYVAQISDASCGREFHNIIGKEDIDGEVHYLVDWTPTLVRGEVLKKAKAQLLIDQFESRCQSQAQVALRSVYDNLNQLQNCDKDLSEKQQHKETGTTRGNNKNQHCKRRWKQEQWQNEDVIDTDHSEDSTSNSSDDDSFRPVKKRKLSPISADHRSTLPHQQNIKDRLRQRCSLATPSTELLERDRVQFQSSKRCLSTPIEKSHSYLPNLSKSSGITPNSIIPAGMPVSRNTVTNLNAKKAESSKTCSVVIYSKVQAPISRKTSSRWTSSENKKILNMKKRGCSWEEIHNALPNRTQGAIQVQYSTKIKNGSF
ncbi:hypothetical protein ACHAO1_011141, partial [Botrytis cinerea]